MANKPIGKSPLTVKLIGTGGVGLCLLPTLCRYLHYNDGDFPDVQISLIDGGHFEERHRDRQDFARVGPKATITVEKYRQKFPRLTFFDQPTYVDDRNAAELIQENDVVLVCVDNQKSRKVVSDRAEQLRNVTVVSGGNDWIDGNVLVHIRRAGKNLTPPLANKYHPEILNPTDNHPSQIEEEQSRRGPSVAGPQLLIMNNFLAAMMLNVFYVVVDEKRRKQMFAAAENFAETCCELTTLTAKARTRKV